MQIGRISPLLFSRWIKRKLLIGSIGPFSNASSTLLVLAIHFDNGSPCFIPMLSRPSLLTAGLLLFLSLLVVFVKAVLFLACFMSCALRCWHAASPRRLPLRVFLCQVLIEPLSALAMLMTPQLRQPPTPLSLRHLTFMPSTSRHQGPN